MLYCCNNLQQQANVRCVTSCNTCNNTLQALGIAYLGVLAATRVLADIHASGTRVHTPRTRLIHACRGRTGGARASERGSTLRYLRYLRYMPAALSCSGSLPLILLLRDSLLHICVQRAACRRTSGRRSISRCPPSFPSQSATTPPRLLPRYARVVCA